MEDCRILLVSEHSITVLSVRVRHGEMRLGQVKSKCVKHGAAAGG